MTLILTNPQQSEARQGVGVLRRRGQQDWRRRAEQQRVGGVVRRGGRATGAERPAASLSWCNGTWFDCPSGYGAVKNQKNKYMIDKIKQHAEKLNEEQAAYFLSGVFILSALFTIKITQEYAKIFLAFSIFFSCYGFFVFLLPRLRQIWESFLGKFIISGLIFTGSTFSISLAKTAINTTFQVPASPFIHTQALLSALLAPLTASILLSIASVFMIPILMPFILSKNETFSLKHFLLLWHRDSFIPENTCIVLIRFIVFFFFLTIFFAFGSNNNWYTHKLMKLARWYAYNFETEQFSYCKLEKDERIAYISDDNIVIATEKNGQYLFRTGKCVNVN